MPVESLKSVLADLYPDTASIRRIVKQVGLNLSLANLSDNAANAWDSVVTQANQRAMLPELVEAALGQYPEHKKLLRIAGWLQYSPSITDARKPVRNSAIMGYGYDERSEIQKLRERMSVMEARFDSFVRSIDNSLTDMRKDFRDMRGFIIAGVVAIGIMNAVFVFIVLNWR